MKKLTLLLAACAASASFAASANAAAYVKYDGVDGEAKSAQWSGDNKLYLTTDQDPQAVGLLLPAVQAAREAARRTSSGRARSFAKFEIEDGGKRYTLHNAQVRPTSNPHRVEITYRCKDWKNLRNGKTGSDCGGVRKGHVETTWKVEEGES